MARLASDPPLATADPSTTHHLLRLLVVFACCWLPALVGVQAVRRASALFPLALTPHPYFAPGHAALLYFWAPLVVAGACVLFLSPGLLLALALGAARGIGDWLLYGYALSLVLVSAVAAVGQSLTPAPLRGEAFGFMVAACSLACFAFLAARLRRGPQRAHSPLSESGAPATLLVTAAAAVLLLIALTPKFYWENFTSDGAHVLYCARLLFVQPVPFWPSAIFPFPGITSVLFIFPASWFVRLFGEVEASVRLPLLLHLIALFGGILALAEEGRARRLELGERCAIWLAVAGFAVTMAFSDTYDPYSADIANPAAQHVALLPCFLGFVLSYLRRDWKWLSLFLALSFLAAPNGALLIALWPLAAIGTGKGEWRHAWTALALLLACALLALGAAPVLRLLHLPAPGSKYGLRLLLGHFSLLQWSGWRRTLYLIVPGGILPAAGLFAWRRHDRVSRALTLVTLCYFAFFYFQARTVLHYYAPAMVLPVVVFWRSNITADPRRRRYVLAGALLAGAAALTLSLPRNADPDTSARTVGEAIEDRVGGYETYDPGALRRPTILRHLFPFVWDPSVPGEAYGGSPQAWFYYAHSARRGTEPVNYILQPVDIPPPDGTRRIAVENHAALFVVSDEIWARHRHLHPPAPAGSPLYEIPRGLLFPGLPLPPRQEVMDVRPFVRRYALRVDALRKWIR